MGYYRAPCGCGWMSVGILSFWSCKDYPKCDYGMESIRDAAAVAAGQGAEPAAKGETHQ